MPRELSSEQVESFRDDLVRVATRRFAEHGVAGVTLRALAAELGCSPMTPYRYFRNKDEIFEAVRTAAFRQLGDHVTAAATAHENPVERLAAASRAYLRFAREEPHAYRIMFQLDQQGLEPGPAQHAEIQRGWRVVVGAMEDAVRAGVVEGDAVTLAHLAWVSLHGIVTLDLAGKLILERSFDDLVEPMLAVFLRGCAARPDHRGTPNEEQEDAPSRRRARGAGSGAGRVRRRRER